MKNIGSERISLSEIQRADVFCGKVGSFDHLTYTNGSLVNTKWTADFGPGYDLNTNSYWDSGETLKVNAKTSISSGDKVYFQFALPNGIWRSNEFTAS
jgi:hypothetical protein